MAKGAKKKRRERPEKRVRPSKLRDSLSARISAGFAGYLARTACAFLPLLLAFALALGLIHLHGAGRRLAASVPGQAVPAGEVRLILAGDAALGPREAPMDPGLARGLFHLLDGRLYVTMNFSGGAAAGTLRVAFDVTDAVRLFAAGLALWLLFELLRLLLLIRHSARVDQTLRGPVGDIEELARRLSASNLDERIDLAGVKGELRALCRIVNEMLDRIQAAYNIQKQFVSDASHELRTPIAVIQGYADMLDRWGKTDPEVRDEAIGAIRSESAAMKELVEQLLFLARHDNKRFVIENSYFDAAALVEEAGRDAALIALERRVRVSALEGCIVRGDRASLKQAIRVFVDNAIKYTPAGGSITLSCRHERAHCRITVADDGMGIAPADLQRIFERFYRTQRVRAGDVGGHGLGLSIARIIVLQHGGKIEVESRLGVGSRFHILIPA